MDPAKKKNSAPKSVPDALTDDPGEQRIEQAVLLTLVGYNCRRAYLSIKPLFEERMAKYELRQIDFSVLSVLKANPNLTPKRLAVAVSLSQPNLAPLLDLLERRGLLLRQRHPGDRRSQTLLLTPAGRRLCTRAEKTASELEHEATSMLSTDERDQLVKLLQKIYLDQ